MRFALCSLCVLLPLATFAQDAEQELMLFDCDSLEGVSISGGKDWPDTKLQLTADAAYLSQGAASLHLSGVSPADATGNSYLNIDIDLGGADLTGRAILFDAWTGQPDNTQALYVRAYDAEGTCVLSHLNWSSPLGNGSMTTFELSRGLSSQLGWEPKMVESDDLSAVAALRFYIGTHDKGVPFDLYLDNIRAVKSNVMSFNDVTEAKQSFPDTVLVAGGEPQAVIVTPEGEQWQQVAAAVQDLVRGLTGANLPIKQADEISDEELKETNAVVIGNVANNRRLLYLYSHYYVFADSAYPGQDGYEVRTVHDPWGTGKNVLAIGASTPQGARAGLEALADQAQQGADLSFAALLLTRLSQEAEAKWGSTFRTEPDDEWFEQQRERAERGIAAGVHGGLFSQAGSVGASYELTEKEGFARAFVWLIKRAYEHYLTKPGTYGGPWGMDSDFRVYAVLPAWDVVEECPALTDDERLEVARILFQWVSEACAPKAQGTVGSERVRHNHQTFPALGLLYAGEYFLKYYQAGEGKAWLDIADAAFTMQSKAFKPYEDCNGYQWLTLYHTMRYALARPDFTYFENGNARRDADYAIMCMDNLGYQVTYGDTGAFTGWWSEMPFLRGAEWYYRDGRYAWATEKKLAVSGRHAVSEFSTTTEAKEPADLIGARAFPLDPHYYRSWGGPEQVPQEHAVDKVVFRDGFDPQDQFLLLDGLSNGGHKHYDGNSISRMTQNDRIWLADASYMLSLPKYHNTVLVLREGQSATLPPFCELEHMRDLPRVGYSETTLRDYAGVNWHRNILWLKNEWFLVADEMEAVEPGEYSFRVVWNTVGEAELGEDGMDVEQAGQHCAIRMTPEMGFTLHDDREYGENWSAYPHIKEPIVRAMCGIWDGRLYAGEQVTLFTLLHASGEQPSRLHLTRLGSNAVAISGEGAEPAIVAVGGQEGLIPLAAVATARCHAALLTAGCLALFDANELEYGGEVLPFGDGQDLEMALGQGDMLVCAVAGRTAEPDEARSREFFPEIADVTDDLVRGLVRDAIAAAPPVKQPAVAGAEAPPLTALWSYREKLESYVVTDNAGAFEAVDAGLEMSCQPEPLPQNVFSQVAGINTLDNITDGVLLQTDGGVQWDDDQQVAITLSFDNIYDVDAITMKAWFATSSSKDKLFQLGRAVVEASDDGFKADVRTIVDFTDEETHGNWGAPGYGPVSYEFGDLGAHARGLRLTLTPRPGTAIYLGEVEVWGNREGLELDLATLRDRGVPVHVFNSLWAADVDGDGADEVIAGSTNGKVYLFDGDGTLLWSREAGGVVNSVCAADLRGDGNLAVIAGCTGATVSAFSAAGEELWTFEVPRYKRTGHVRCVFPADLTGDGKQAVIAGADNWRYYALDAEGSKLWHFESVHGSTAGAAADLDGDGKEEVICGTEYYWWPVVKPDGSRLFSYSTRTGPGVNAALAADLTGDGTPEVIFGGQDSNVHTVSAAGKLLWQFNTGDEVTGLASIGPDEGAKTLIVGSRSFNLYAVDGEGGLVWRTDLGYAVTDVAVLAGPEGPRVVAAAEDGSVCVVEPAEGRIIGRFAAGDAALTVVAADLDGDGVQEIVASSADGNMAALR